MNALWVLAVVIGSVAGDIGIGYHYKVPQTSYGVPTYQSSANSEQSYKPSFIASSSSGNYNNGYNNNLGAASNYYTSQSNTQGQQSSTFGQNSGYQNGFQSAGNAAGIGLNNNYHQSSSSGFIQPSYQSGADYSAFNQYQTSSQYQSSAADKYQQYYNVIQQQPAQVFKHYYVHAAPEEPETSRPRQPIVLPPPQKHYKIIFIKTPSAPAQAPQIIPVQQQNEEKTIVYVLVKKPEEAQDIVLPKIEQKPPSKPEVYFIKYNNKQDSQAVINNIVTDLNKGGNSDSDYSGISDASGSFSGLNQDSVSNGQTYEQGINLAQNQGSSSTFDSSSLVSSSAFGSGMTGSSDSNSFSSGSNGGFSSGSTVSSGSFGSGLIGTGNYGSGYGSSTGTYGSSSNAFGSSNDEVKGHNISIAPVDSGDAEGGYDSSSGSSGYHGSAVSSGYDSVSSTASTLTGYDASAISTSQGVPHETYGPPKFKAL